MQDETTPADIVASILERTGDIHTVYTVRAVNYRAPIHLLAKVDAMAGQAGKTRGYMISRLLTVGIDAVTKSLVDETTINELVAREMQALQELSGGTNDSEAE